jgi:hypothetical protein
VLLEKHFILNKYYQKVLSRQGKQSSINFSSPMGEAKKGNRGVHNKGTFMLNVETFINIV